MQDAETVTLRLKYRNNKPVKIGNISVTPKFDPKGGKGRGSNGQRGTFVITLPISLLQTALARSDTVNNNDGSSEIQPS